MAIVKSMFYIWSRFNIFNGRNFPQGGGEVGNKKKWGACVWDLTDLLEHAHIRVQNQVWGS